MATIDGVRRASHKWRVTLTRIGCGASIAAYGRTMESAFDRAVKLAGPAYIGASAQAGHSDIMHEIGLCFMYARDSMRDRRGGAWRRTENTHWNGKARVILERV